jgi:hypothetical protein
MHSSELCLKPRGSGDLAWCFRRGTLGSILAWWALNVIDGTLANSLIAYLCLLLPHAKWLQYVTVNRT